MEINDFINLIKKKIIQNIEVENIIIEDKSFLHKKHKNFSKDKYHLKLSITSKDLKLEGKLKANRIVYKILDNEIKKYIHSIQVLIN